MKIIYSIIIIISIVSCSNSNPNEQKGGNKIQDDFELEDLGIEIHCPYCNNEMINDPNSLHLAWAICGADLECGKCYEITSWRWTMNPFNLKQVPITYGGTIECK